MFKEPDKPTLFDEIQHTVFTSSDKVAKVFAVLNDDVRLCLICNKVFTKQAAAEQAERVRYPS